MNKLIILTLFSLSFLFGMKLEKGANLVIANKNLSSIMNQSWSKYILKMYSVNNGSYTSFDPKDVDFSDFTSLKSGKGYIVIVNNSVDIPDFEAPVNVSETCVKLVKGANIVALPNIDLTKKTSINGAKILKIYGVNNGSYTSFDPNDVTFSDFTSTKNGKVYIVIVNNDGNKVTSCSASETNTSDVTPPTPKSDDTNNTFFPPQTPNIQ